MSRRSLVRVCTLRSKLSVCARAAVVAPRGEGEQSDRKHRTHGVAALLGAVLLGSTLKDEVDKRSQLSGVAVKAEEPEKKDNDGRVEAGQPRQELPTYTADEVRQHDNKSSFWVTYKHGVYDVTRFLSSHPGGEQIYNAAGLSVEPFWNVYGMHKTPEVFALLETFRIGNLHPDDVLDHADDELWAREPARDHRLLVRTAQPFNAEIPAALQVEHFDTPNELFYVRQHMPVPELDPARHRLTVRVLGPAGTRETCLTLQELDKFPRATVRAALMCAGNRRSEMDKVKPVKGISWAGGAVSCATWGGVYLRDVLLHAGVDSRDVDGKHVILQGSDIDATGVNFSTSIPLHMALDGDILLATHMNGAPLPRDHGAPLRAVVPGAPAVRSVKWLESVTVSTEESGSHWHQKDYRSFNASETWDTAHFPSAPPLYSLPVTSAICRPAHGDTVSLLDGCLELQGYAYSGGGAKIVRVDVSGDGGATWTQAQLETDTAPHRRHYAWALWTVRLPVSPHVSQVEVWAKATDGNFNTQPETFHHIWNIRGILSNAYHRITVSVTRPEPER